MEELVCCLTDKGQTDQQSGNALFANEFLRGIVFKLKGTERRR